MPFNPDVVAFVHAAVRLPHDRLRRIDRQWDSLSIDRRVISELVQASNEVRLQMSQLRDYITTAARMARATGEAETGPTSLLAEDVAEAIFPAARAIFLRDLLENPNMPGRAAAFVALTAPFLTLGSNPQVPPESNAAIAAWMRNQGWNVAPARWELDPETGFHVWQETEATAGKSHALWIAEPMVRHLSAEQLVNVLNNEGMAEEIRISFKMRIQERGDGYRVSIVSRRSGEWRRQE